MQLTRPTRQSYLPKNFLKPLDFFLVSGEDGRGAPSWGFRGGTPAKSRCSVPLRSVSAVKIITLTWRPDPVRSAGNKTTGAPLRPDVKLNLTWHHPCKRLVSYHRTFSFTAANEKCFSCNWQVSPKKGPHYRWFKVMDQGQLDRNTSHQS